MSRALTKEDISKRLCLNIQLQTDTQHAKRKWRGIKSGQGKMQFDR